MVNAIKHEKRGTPRFSDNLNYPPQKNFGKNPKDPLPPWISNYCSSMGALNVLSESKYVIYKRNLKTTLKSNKPSFNKIPFEIPSMLPYHIGSYIQIETVKYPLKVIYFNLQY